MLVIIYIALIAPVLGVGLSITATEGLYIPTFISSVIEGSVLYSALALIAVLFFLGVGIADLFILTLGLSVAAVAVVCLFIPLKLISLLPPGSVSRLLTIFFAAAGVVISAMADLLAVPVYLLKMTQLYFSYQQGKARRCSCGRATKKARRSTSCARMPTV